MSISPFFSIIIPVYNKATYIHKCIQSILTQSFRDFEIVIINDGSKDKSEEIILSFHDERIIYLKTDNYGASHARNLGLDISRGQYLLFIDSDDYIGANYLSSIHDVLIFTHSDILIFGMTKINSDKSYEVITPIHRGHITIEDFKKGFINEMNNNYGIYGYISNKAVLRNLIETHHLRFDEAKRLAEDLDFWLAVYSHCSNIYFSSIIEYYYLQNAENSSVFYTNVDYLALIDIWSKALQFMMPFHSDSMKLFNQKFSGLVSAHFNEMSDIRLKQIKSSMAYIEDAQDEFHYNLLTNTLVNKLVRFNLPFILYAYLKARRIYHTLYDQYHRSRI